MKRLIVVLCVVGFIVALPLSHSAIAKPKLMTPICHVTGSVAGLATGRVIGVPLGSKAESVHLAHGDIADGDFTYDDGPPDLEGGRLQGARCTEKLGSTEE